MEYKNVYVGAFASSEYVFEDFRDLTASTHGALILSNQDAGEDFLYGAKELDRSRCVKIPVDSARNHYRIILYIPTAYVLGAFSWFQYAILIIALVSFSFVTSMLIITWRQMVSPVLRIIEAMEAVDQGDFNCHLPIPDTHDEFAELTETFNYMIGQIHDLKLQIYEEKLNQAYAELQYLTLQIKPHFFLNCLKSLYALAEAGKYDRIQKMILAVSRHIRYIFQDSMELVPLSRELDHIRNYIEMQGGSSQYAPVCRIDADARLLSMMIPPLSLQTFVENSVKHDYSPDHPLEIDVRAAVLCSGGDTFADLTVSDNGSGFPESVIQEINDPDSPVYAQRHVGINNIKKRMELIYGEGVLYAFFNRDVGSVSEIFIPIDPKTLPENEEKEEGT